MSGPPKTPTHLRLVRVTHLNARSMRMNQNPLLGYPQRRSISTSRGNTGSGVWLKELDALGVMSQLDARALELLVEVYTEYRHHCDTLEREGYTYAVYSDEEPDEGKEREIRMIKAHPAAIMKADARKRLRAMLGEFGMTPASRSKVNAKGPDAVDPLAEFMKARD